MSMKNSNDTIAPWPLYPLVSRVQDAGWASRPVWTCAEIFAQVNTPNNPFRARQLLYTPLGLTLKAAHSTKNSLFSVPYDRYNKLPFPCTGFTEWSLQSEHNGPMALVWVITQPAAVITNYSLRNNPEERWSLVLRDGSVKSRSALCQVRTESLRA